MLTEKLAMLTLHLYAWFPLDRNGFMKSCDPGLYEIMTKICWAVDLNPFQIDFAFNCA